MYILTQMIFVTYEKRVVNFFEQVEELTKKGFFS